MEPTSPSKEKKRKKQDGHRQVRYVRKGTVVSLVLYVVLALMAIGFMTASIVMKSMVQDKSLYQNYVPTNCSVVGFNVSSSGEGWEIRCNFVFKQLQRQQQQQKGFNSTRRTGLLPPLHKSNFYLTMEEALLDGSNVCPTGVNYLCWYDVMNPSDHVQLSPPNVPPFEIPIIVCFTLMVITIFVGALFRFGYCPWATCLQTSPIPIPITKNFRKNYRKEKQKPRPKKEGGRGGKEENKIDNNTTASFTTSTTTDSVTTSVVNPGPAGDGVENAVPLDENHPPGDTQLKELPTDRREEGEEEEEEKHNNVTATNHAEESIVSEDSF